MNTEKNYDSSYIIYLCYTYYTIYIVYIIYTEWAKSMVIVDIYKDMCIYIILTVTLLFAHPVYIYSTLYIMLYIYIMLHICIIYLYHIYNIIIYIPVIFKFSVSKKIIHHERRCQLAESNTGKKQVIMSLWQHDSA